MTGQKPRSLKGLWLHAYGIRPPQPRRLLRKIAALLEAESRRARRAGRTWSGALISDAPRGPVTHVVLVSDSARRDEAVQLSLEVELKKLTAAIVLPMPLRLPRERDATAGTGKQPRRGSRMLR